MKINTLKLGMITFLVLLVTSLVPIFGVVAASVEVNQTEPKVLVWAQNSPFGTENAAVSAQTVYADYYFSSIYNGLMRREIAADRAFVNDLAASMPVISSDYRNWTFTLRDGLKFSDGSDLNASSVVFSYKVALTASINVGYASFAPYFTNSSIYEVDNLTVQFNMTKSYAFAQGLFSAFIYSEDHFGSMYTDCLADATLLACNWNTDLTGGNIVGGAGPFMLDKYDTTNNFMELVPNPLYYKASEIKLDRIVIRTIVSAAAAKVAFAAGDTNIFDSQYKAKAVDFANLAGIDDVFVGAPGIQEMSINHQHPYFGVGNYTTAARDAIGASAYTKIANDTASRNIRKAMSHMIDRVFISDEIAGGLATPASTWMSNVAIGWDATLAPRLYDIDLAKAYMVDAGFNFAGKTFDSVTGAMDVPFFEMTVLSPTGNADREQWAALMVTELPKIGIGVKEHVTGTFSAVAAQTFAHPNPPPSYDLGGYDIFFVGYSQGLEFDPTGLWEKANWHPVGDNFYNYDNSTLDAAIVAYVAELDAAKRLPLVKIVQAILYDDQPVIPIVYPTDHWAWNDNIVGLDGLSMSQRLFEWELVDIILEEPTDPDTVTVIDTVSGETVTKTEETPVSVMSIFFAITFTAFIAVYRRRN